jgi:hypothetical protein
LSPFFGDDRFNVVRYVGSVFGKGCDASVACSVVLESLVYYCGYFLCCSVASLVGSAGQVVSSFVVPLTTLQFLILTGNLLTTIDAAWLTSLSVLKVLFVLINTLSFS